MVIYVVLQVYFCAVKLCLLKLKKDGNRALTVPTGNVTFPNWRLCILKICLPCSRQTFDRQHDTSQCHHCFELHLQDTKCSCYVYQALTVIKIADTGFNTYQPEAIRSSSASTAAPRSPLGYSTEVTPGQEHDPAWDTNACELCQSIQLTSVRHKSTSHKEVKTATRRNRSYNKCLQQLGLNFHKAETQVTRPFAACSWF